jgi:putative transcriptional regulator
MNSLQGYILVASPQLADPNFRRSVVLIIQHNDQGALGLILNRPLETSIDMVWDQVSDSPCLSDHPLHQGGPCESDLLALYSGQAYGEAMGDLKVLPGVWFISNKNEIETVLSDADSRVRCFIGYSGWGVGQLDAEIQAGSWLIHPAVEDYIFSDNPRIWSKLMTRLTLGKDINPSQLPDDPSVN